jgi:carboxylate-amine ligase
MRPRPLFGTLEVRVMDAQPSLVRAAGLTALVQGIARWAVERPDAVDLSDEVLALNDHRAATHGLEARVVDMDGTPRPLRQVAARALSEARQVLGTAGSPLDAVEEMLSGLAEPDRQRRLVADEGMAALLEDLVTRTTDPEG